MGIKHLIKQKKILESGVINNEMTLPGEPMIYSVKYSLRKRRHSVQYFRNKQWNSIIKCLFPSYFNVQTPVALWVRFFVSPPEDHMLNSTALKNETIPAVRGHELCDYLLSFLEILHRVLIAGYRQFCKIDVEKYYSLNPRTVFKFMKWDHHVYNKNNNTADAEAKRIGQVRS